MRPLYIDRSCSVRSRYISVGAFRPLCHRESKHALVFNDRARRFVELARRLVPLASYAWHSGTFRIWFALIVPEHECQSESDVYCLVSCLPSSDLPPQSSRTLATFFSLRHCTHCMSDVTISLFLMSSERRPNCRCPRGRASLRLRRRLDANLADSCAQSQTRRNAQELTARLVRLGATRFCGGLSMGDRAAASCS